MPTNSNCGPPAQPYNPCELLKLAQEQMAALATGRHVRLVETPQLGRVEYSTARASDLQRMIDTLKRECAAYLGIPTAATARGPISIEVDP